MIGQGGSPDYMFESAWRLHQAGNLAEAVRLYNEVLRANPKHFGALQLLGFLYFQRSEFEAAEKTMARALKIDPKSVDALYNRGCALQALERHKEALQCFDKALSIKQDFVPALLNRGNALSRLGRHSEALASYDRALALQPRSPDVLLNRANVLLELERPDEALAAYDKALQLEPNHPVLWNNRGNALVRLAQREDALSSFDKAVALDPSYPDPLENRADALENLGRSAEALEYYSRALAIAPENPSALHKRARLLFTLRRPEAALADLDRVLVLDPDNTAAMIEKSIAFFELKRHDDALEICNHVLRRDPDNADALSNHANALIALKRHQEALKSSDNALTVKPNHAAALHNRASALAGLRRYGEALAAFDKTLTIAPHNATTWNSRGSAALGLKRYEEAIQNFDTSLSLDPDKPEVLANRAAALSKLKRYPEAIEACEQALAQDPNDAAAMREMIHCRLNSCDWRCLPKEKATIAAALAQGKRKVQPFDNLTISVSEESNRVAAELWVADECPQQPQALWRGERYRHDKIRLCYLSTDLRAHAVAFLIVGAFEHHDKTRFETVALSIGSDDGSETRERILAAFDRFVDVRDKSDAEIAALMKEMEIDIAIDLNGYTGDSRTGILAHRPAPLQVNYLGYPGTMAAPYIDYILADCVVIPERVRETYSECVVYLPDTYQANDSRRRVSAKTVTRADAGLPQNGFVFCCFNQAQKIQPELFGIWMRLLHNVEDSVLWLLDDNRFAVANLRHEAEARGIAPDRLVFARRTTPAEHLARIHLADLFLDTLPYNAHTTASDALWVGLPLVTCVGSTFPGRVAASLLHAAGLPELVVESLADYETLALTLARDASALAAVKMKLSAHRDSCALFDTTRFTQHLESAYATMWERYQQGLPPAPFAVTPVDKQ